MRNLNASTRVCVVEDAGNAGIVVTIATMIVTICLEMTGESSDSTITLTRNFILLSVRMAIS